VKKKTLLITLIVAIVIISGYMLRETNENTQIVEAEDENQEVEVKMPAIEFTLEDLLGSRIYLSDYKGKKVFLQFWTIGCTYCKEMMPYINEVYIERNDIEVITINSGDNKERIQEYLEENNYKIKVLPDINLNVTNQYNAGSPTSILIDEEGNIINRVTGKMNKEEILDFIALKLKTGIPYINITDDEAKEEIEKDSSIILLDVRTEEEYNEKHIPNSRLIPIEELETRAEKELKEKDRKIFIYCGSGGRSATAARMLIDLGYTNVYNLGGIIHWKYETE